MSKKSIAVTILLATQLLCLPWVTGAQSIEEVAAGDVRGLRVGFALGLYHEGQLSALDAFGKTGPETEELLTPDHLFAFPALTEVLIGATIQALAHAEVLDLDAPISTYFPLLSPRLGTVRLSQLLDHSSGLDDARVREGQEFSEAVLRLNDRTLFTDPGFIHSRSRYSYPLALLVLEKAVGSTFPEIAARAILDPLGMTRSTFDPERARELGLATGLGPSTDESSPYVFVEPVGQVDGLPVLFTTVPDVIRFLSSWMAGGIRGTPPWADPPGEGESELPGDTGFRSGIEIDEYEGHLRVSRTGSGLGMAAGFHLFPESQTALVTWGIGSRPRLTTTVALERIAGALRARDETPDETLDRTVEALGLNRPQEAEASFPTEPEIHQVPSHEKGWAGTYLNGEYKVELREGDGGLLHFTGDDELPVTPGPNGIMTAIREDRRVRIAFRLQVDRNGRRYARLGDKAFLHTKDARVWWAP